MLLSPSSTQLDGANEDANISSLGISTREFPGVDNSKSPVEMTSLEKALLDSEGGWPAQYQRDQLPVGVGAENWDFHAHGPRVCVVNFFLRDLVEVNTVQQTFRPRLQMTIDWVDDGALRKVDESEGNASYWTGGFELNPEVVGESGVATVENVWSPQIELVNGVEG